ncbi:T9SS type A sorting domain-containing protein [candidate division KSB1 bacterium]|nr:T9SS type A sorting domain-containing protein [candidate division KSB1 bacterium]
MNTRIFAVSLLLLWVRAAFGQLHFVQESDFFSIPGLDALSDEWFIASSDSTDFGFQDPLDIEVIRLSPYDYRIVVLDGGRPHFIQFRVTTTDSLHYFDVVSSGDDPGATDPLRMPRAMCQMKRGTYFDPVTDFLVVADAAESRLALYRFSDSTGEVTLSHFVSSPMLGRPVGVYWGVGSFFVLDETNSRIVRVDTSGAVLSTYGRWGVSPWSYRWISDIAGFVDSTGTAHLYVVDTKNSRVDHLTARESNARIYRHSSVWCVADDSLYMYPRDVTLMPGVGVVVYDWAKLKLLCWTTFDSLNSSIRYDAEVEDLVPGEQLVRIRQASGRLVLISVSEDGIFRLRSFGIGSTLDAMGSEFDDPARELIVLPTEYWLYQNFPNPFNPNTEIRFDLPEAAQVQLRVFNILGQEVATLVDAMRPAGAYNILWDSKNMGGSTVASGVYVYQLKAGKFTDQKKMVLIR